MTLCCVPLDAPPGGVLGLEVAHLDDLDAVAALEAHHAVHAEADGVDRAADVAAALGLDVGDEVVDDDGDAVVGLDVLAELVDRRLQDGPAGAAEAVELAAAPLAHHQGVGSAGRDEVDQLVDRVDGEGAAVGPEGELLAGAGQRLGQPVEALGVERRVAVEEAVLVEVGGRLGPLHQDLGLEVVGVGVGLAEEVVDVGVAAEDLEGGGDLGEGRGGLGPGVADVVERRGGVGRLAVVGDGRPEDLLERQELEELRVLDDGVDDAAGHQVLGELRGLGLGQRHGVSFGRAGLRVSSFGYQGRSTLALPSPRIGRGFHAPVWRRRPLG